MLTRSVISSISIITETRGDSDANYLRNKFIRCITYSTGAVGKDRMEYRKDITGVHLYSDGLEFPVAVYEKND